MKTLKFAVLGALLCLGAFSASAQLATEGTGSRDAQSLRKEVELFIGCERKIVSFNGVAQNRMIVTGRGVFCGLEIVSATEGGASVVPWKLSFHDAASISDVTLSSASTDYSLALIADQYGGPVGPFTLASWGGAFTSTSMANTRNNQFRQPIKFNKGIMMQNGSAANQGSVAVYWLK